MPLRRVLPLFTTLLLACTGDLSEADTSEDAIVQTDPLRLVTSRVAEVARCKSLKRSDCADVDGDGLTDAWEDLVLARFSPRLEFDEQERGLKDPRFRMGIAGRVVARPEDPTSILVFFGFAFSEDYGACSFTEHHGDMERAVLELKRTPNTDGEVTISRAFTAAHEGDITSKSRTYTGGEDALKRSLEFVSESSGQRWLLYVSRNKHAIYATRSSCESMKLWCLADYCGGDGADSPNHFRRALPILNSGEPEAPRESGWTTFGYADVDVWTTKNFCGVATSGDCDGAPRKSLVRDPFTGEDL